VSQARSLHVQKLLVLTESCLTQNVACIVKTLTIHAACLQQENADAAGHTVICIIPSESYVEQDHSRINWEVHLHKSGIGVSPGLQCLAALLQRNDVPFPTL